MFKGWKTIVFNAVMLAVGITGAQVNPELVTEFAEGFVGVLTVGNGILRGVTNSPIFSAH